MTPRLLPIAFALAALSLSCDSTQGQGPDAASDTAEVDAPAPDAWVDDGDVTDIIDGSDAAEVTEPLPWPAGPPAINLTVNRVPRSMNGAVPYLDAADGVERTFRLRVNRASATLDVLAEPGSGAIDWGSLAVTCLTEGEALPVGPFAVDPDERGASYHVAAAAPLPDGAVIACDAHVVGLEGEATSSLTFEAAHLPSSLDPFEEVDEWLVVISRDIFELVITPRADGTFHVTSHHRPGGNGVADFDEAFIALGLLDPANPAAADVVKAHLLRRIRAHANRIFGLDPEGRPTPEGVRLRLWFEGDPGAPTPADFPAGELSMIALGGDGAPADQAAGTFGRARLDWNNQGVEDNTVHGLGVFTAALTRLVLGQLIGIYLLEGMLPDRGGTPFGSFPGDELFIGRDDPPDAFVDATQEQRFELYRLAIEAGSLALASVLCHEIGHSLGLVPYGAPPVGLFAGVDGPAFLQSFVAGPHIDTEGLNVMQTGSSVSWLTALGAEPTFNALNWAYLRRQLVVGPPD